MEGILATGAILNLETLVGHVSSVIGMFIAGFGEVLTFMTTNSGLLIWFLVSIAGAIFVYFRKLI